MLKTVLELVAVALVVLITVCIPLMYILGATFYLSYMELIQLISLSLIASVVILTIVK